MMNRILVALAIALWLTGCSDPKNTQLPKDIEKMEAIKPALEKLQAEERELLAGYVMRQTIGAKLGGLLGGQPGAGIPDGMTIGKAIDEQRKFMADRAIEEAKEQALKQKLKAEREAAMKLLREAVTVTMVSKKLRDERGVSGMVLDELLEVSFGYKNNTTKDIAGVKGKVSIRDLFDDEISAFVVSNDDSIRAGQSAVWKGSRSVKYAMGSNKDRKLAELADDKYKVIWEPRVIVFSDGTKMTAPE